MHYYSFHIGDYRAATARLTNEEDLAYRRLIDMYYDSESCIPLDTQWVSRRIRIAIEVVEVVLKDMFEATPEGWKSQRCDDEIARYRHNAEKNKLNGIKGGRPKKNPMGTQSEPNEKATNNHKPITINQEPKVSTRSKAATPPPDVDAEVWEDWKQLRKAKRATVTETVVNEARKEATKAGMSLNQFLKEWCLRGSQGLKAEWLTNNQADKRTEHQKRQDATARALLGDAYYATPTMKAIEGEVIHEEPPFTRRLG